MHSLNAPTKSSGKPKTGHVHALRGQDKAVPIGAKFEDPLLKLQEEHSEIANEITLLLNTARKRSKTHERSTELSSKTLAYSKHLELQLTAHQTREERVLIPVISKYLDTSIIAEMLDEHQEISQAMRHTAATLALKSDDNQASLTSVAESVEKLASLTRSHFSREENVVFWFARLFLSESDFTQMEKLTQRLRKSGSLNQ